MLQNPCKTLGFKKNMVYKIPPGGKVNHIQPVAYTHIKELVKSVLIPLFRLAQKEKLRCEFENADMYSTDMNEIAYMVLASGKYV